MSTVSTAARASLAYSSMALRTAMGHVDPAADKVREWLGAVDEWEREIARSRM